MVIEISVADALRVIINKKKNIEEASIFKDKDRSNPIMLRICPSIRIPGPCFALLSLGRK